jgi:hypothetical protein
LPAVVRGPVDFFALARLAGKRPAMAVWTSAR